MAVDTKEPNRTSPPRQAPAGAERACGDHVRRSPQPPEPSELTQADKTSLRLERYLNPEGAEHARGNGGAEVDADPDRALVALAKAGDQRAFGELFERHHGRVYAMCCRMLRDPAEVEDAVQHAFLEAWRCLHRFEGRSRFSTWITRIAIHTCFGIRRRLKRLFFSEDLPSSHARTPQYMTAPLAPDAGAEHSARQRAVDDILHRLSEKKRVVFVLAEFEGMTAPEIADVVACPEATVRTRLFHARRDFMAIARSEPAYRELFGLPTTEGM